MFGVVGPANAHPVGAAVLMLVMDAHAHPIGQVRAFPCRYIGPTEKVEITSI